MVAPDALVMVAALRQDDSVCRRAEQILEMVNGSILACRASSDGLPVGAEPAVPVDLPDGVSAFHMYKFDMAESRFLIDRYDVKTLPWCAHAPSMGASCAARRP